MTNLPATTPSNDGIELLKQQASAMEAAHKLATTLCNTQMVPATFRGKPDDGAAAILYGAELGLKPQQALQQIFVVHGQPAIYARTMVALLKAKGYTFTTVDTSDTSVTVTGTSPRGETETATWTIDRAKKAGYTTNKKYQSDPQAMLYAKAASEVCRKLAPDVLLGIKYTAEDLELEPIQMTATRQDIREKAQAPVPQLEAPQPVDDVDSLIRAVQAITDPDDLKEFMNKPRNLTPENTEKLREAANTRYFEINNPGDEQ